MCVSGRTVEAAARRMRFYFYFFISLIADGPHSTLPVVTITTDRPTSTRLTPYDFFYRDDASSALLQLVNQWLNFTYSGSHAFRYGRKNMEVGHYHASWSLSSLLPCLYVDTPFTVVR